MATDILDIEINIGANTQDLGAELQKAENLLNKLQAKLKKSTDVGEIQKLNTKITSVESAIGTLNTRMNAVGRPAADATNALGNLSRVAQDAPYGFIGIANNLNPLLESFQRLSKESGSSSNALKAMVSGLTGPAGIGIALGVVSSLVVAFGDDIAEFINKATGGSQAIVEFGKSFTAAKDAFSSAYIQMENLNNSFDQFHNGTKSKKSVLDEYNQSLGKVYGTTKDIAEAEKIFIDNKDNYVKAALYRAAGQVALKKAAEEAFKQLEAQNAPSTANKTSMFMCE
jgi:DNA repair ATPase RecN